MTLVKLMQNEEAQRTVQGLQFSCTQGKIWGLFQAHTRPAPCERRGTKGDCNLSSSSPTRRQDTQVSSHLPLSLFLQLFHRIILGIKGVMETKVLSEHKRLCNMAIVTISFKRGGVWGRKKKQQNVTMYQFLSRFPQQKPQKLECVMQIGRKADRASNQGITPLRNKKSDF